MLTVASYIRRSGVRGHDFGADDLAWLLSLVANMVLLPGVE